MAGYYETKTMLRNEFDEANKGTEAGLRVSYEQYLKNIGLNSEAEAIAQRAKEDAEGKTFGVQQLAKDSGVFGTATRADRKISDEEEAANQAAQASNDAFAAKQIIALSGGRITGKEPVYVLGTPEHEAYMQKQFETARATGKQPQAPDAYLDAQAFAARYMAYNRLGSNESTYLDWDPATNSFVRKQSPFFDPKIAIPTVGMGNDYQALQQRLFAAPAGRQRDAVQQEIDVFFGRQIGYAPGGTIRDFPKGVKGLGFEGGFDGEAAAKAAGTTDKTILNTVEDFEGNIITNYSDGSSTSTDSNGQITELSGSTADDTVGTSTTSETKAKKVSAYNQLYDEFNQYGVGSLVSDVKNILLEGPYDPADFALKVRGTKAYKERFIANEARIAKGLRALSPASYVSLEDQYQEVMRQYGLPASYYAKSPTGVQEGFNKLIENDVSNVELEDRIATAQKRVINANPEVITALKQFYPDINNGDILAYTLDPKNAIENIKRKVTSAEIGGAAIQSGLGYKGDTPEAIRARAEELGNAGVTKETAQQGFGMIAGGLQRGSQLAAIYGEDPYTQTTAETEVFRLAGGQEARKKRQKVTGLEQAAFGGKTGITSGALVRDRAGAY
jgi:hypothetical protein